MDTTLPKSVGSFKSWFVTNGGHFHPNAQFQQDTSGYRIVADNEIPPDTTIVTCPFALVITKELATDSILTVLKTNDTPPKWTERQFICTYVCLHWVFEAFPDFPESLAHLPYIKILPKQEQLLTPLQFSDQELEFFKGSHLYGATIDRKNALRGEWKECLEYLTAVSNDEVYRQRYTWEQYLTATTYLSSRAFPSTLISENPSLAPSRDSYPVLLPGVDSFNHARGRPVSWVIDPLPTTGSSDGLGQQLGLSLVVHSWTRAGEELLNNYGPKPNSELILGYGFSLEDNPDDTIVLSIGGGPTTPASNSAETNKWEVGRNARGVEGVWRYVSDAVSSSLQPEAEESPATRFEGQLDAASMLSEMCQLYLGQLPQVSQFSGAPATMARPEVLTMFSHYIEGQRDIVESILRFAEEKEEEAVEEARKLGIELEFE